ncbi:hypothetical protein BHM03_00006663, partial [Ensete ventricosum]
KTKRFLNPPSRTRRLVSLQSAFLISTLPPFDRPWQTESKRWRRASPVPPSAIHPQRKPRARSIASIPSSLVSSPLLLEIFLIPLCSTFSFNALKKITHIFVAKLAGCCNATVADAIGSC